MYTGYYNEVYQYKEEDRLVSNSITLEQVMDLPEIRADIALGQTDIIVVKGILKDCKRCPIVGQCVKLLCKKIVHHTECYELVGETLTDQEGKYSIEVCGEEGCEYYIIAEGQPVEQINQFLQNQSHLQKPNHTMQRHEGIAPNDNYAAQTHVCRGEKLVKCQANRMNKGIVSDAAQAVYSKVAVKKISDYVKFY